MPGRVDDGDVTTVPFKCSGRSRDRNAVRLFNRATVHFGVARVDITDLMDPPRIKQNAFRQCGLASVNMCHDANVADIINVPGHN